MAGVSSVAAKSAGWSSGAQGPPSAVLLVGVLLLALGGSIALGWSAYSGQAALSLALVVAGGGFLFVVSRPDLGILILLSTMLFTYPDILQGQGLLTINNILGVMFALLLMGRIFASHDLWFLREREVKIFFALSALFLVATAVAEYTLPKLRYPLIISEQGRIAKDLTGDSLKDFFSRLAFFIFFINFITTRRQFLSVLLLFAGCVVLVIPPAIQVYLSGAGEDGRVTAGFLFGGGSGWLSNPNRFAFMCLLGTGLLFSLASGTRRSLLKLLAILCAIPLSALVLLSGSRSGLLGFLFTLGWLLFAGRAGAPQYGLRASTGLLGVAAVTAFLLLAPPLVQQRLLNLNPFNPEGEGTNSTEVREATAEQSIAMFMQYPVVGVGIGNFRWMNAYMYGNHKPPHNSYLWALSEGGIGCLGLYIALFVLLLKRLARLRPGLQADPLLSATREWLVFYLLLLLFFSLFADVWLEEVHLYLVAGLSIVLQRLATAQEVHAQSAHSLLH